MHLLLTIALTLSVKEFKIFKNKCWRHCEDTFRYMNEWQGQCCHHDNTYTYTHAHARTETEWKTVRNYLIYKFGRCFHFISISVYVLIGNRTCVVYAQQSELQETFQHNISRKQRLRSAIQLTHNILYTVNAECQNSVRKFLSNRTKTIKIHKHSVDFSLKSDHLFQKDVWLFIKESHQECWGHFLPCPQHHNTTTPQQADTCDRQTWYTVSWRSIFMISNKSAIFQWDLIS